MKKILITGFDPFGGESVNPSYETAKKLVDIPDCQIKILEVPTVYYKSFDKVLSVAREFSPDVILCLGQAGGRDSVTPELVAINYMHASIPDNDGNSFDGKILDSGDTAYFTTLPVWDMAERVSAKGIPCKVSTTAGTFVCNHLFYMLLNYYADTNVKVGFVHIPFIQEQAKGKYPYLTLEQSVTAITEIIKNL